MRIGCILVLAAIFMSPALYAQTDKSKAKADDWPTYNRDLAGTRYSPLTQINTKNVAGVKQAWAYRLRGDAPDGPASFGGTTPIVVDGVMYLPAGKRVVALEPETGKEIWRFELDGPTDIRRGVAYWPGDKEHPARIIFNTSAARTSKMMALNAKTGKIDPGFGKEGVVELDVRYNSPPTVYKNILVIGSNTQEVPVDQPGDSRAYDARTGAKLWEFHSVPRPGEIGHDSWLDDGWRGRSGVNVWGFYMTVDEERGIIYMPFGGPAGNYYGGDRPGPGLFGNSLVAVDINTGKLKWYFQTVHHDLWDQDLPPAPGLIDIVRNGKKIPALAEIGKTGWMFILDRTTGRPVFGVEERPVTKGDVPDEWYSPTQPFPVKPPALARISFKPEDIVTETDTNAAHAKACRDLVARHGGELHNTGPFTPFLYHEEGAPPRSTINFPGSTGGTNWGGTATDPKLGYVFVNTHDSASVGWVEKKKPGANYGRGTDAAIQAYDRGSVLGPGGYTGFSASFKDENGRTLTWPCQKPPWGRLFAVNANTGDIAWEATLGVTDELPAGKRGTGRSNLGGPIVTAGGVLFIGATSDHRFRAFDSRTGKELWVTNLEYNAQSTPITYRGKNGKQYVVVITAGGGAYGGGGESAPVQGKNEALVAFALP